MLRIVLVEDHQIVRQGFRALLDREADLAVVAETGDGLEAVRLVEEERPDVLVLDLTLPGLDGLEVARRVGRQAPETRVVVLSMHNNAAYVAEALRAGAAAYVLKESSADDLGAALRAVSEGRSFFSEGVSLPPDDDEAERYDRYDTLSPREREVLHLLAQGLTGPEVAERLFISPRTVETHRSNVLAKLGLRGQTELVHYAIGRGLLPVGRGRDADADDPAPPDV